MQPIITLITLAVADLELSVSFYRDGLKFPTEGIVGAEHENGTELTLAHNVSSREEVDAVMAKALQGGAKSLKPAQSTFYGGYAGYFQDPDGHVWEVAFNPGTTPSPRRGRPTAGL